VASGQIHCSGEGFRIARYAVDSGASPDEWVSAMAIHPGRANVTLYLDEKLLGRVRAAASADVRSLSNFVEVLLAKACPDDETCPPHDWSIEGAQIRCRRCSEPAP
jgi:hypothetical protein